MILTLDLPPEGEGAIAEAARQQGTTPELLAINVLRDLYVPVPSVPQRSIRPYNPNGLIAALNSFDEGDEEEQRQTLEHLKVALDHNRPGERSIFSKGINPMPPAEETH